MFAVAVCQIALVRVGIAAVLGHQRPNQTHFVRIVVAKHTDAHYGVEIVIWPTKHP